jgi:hypothetical protein
VAEVSAKAAETEPAGRGGQSAGVGWLLLRHIINRRREYIGDPLHPKLHKPKV